MNFLQKFNFTKKLPNIYKYGELKFSFKNLIQNEALYRTNIMNRKVEVDVDKILKYHTDFTRKADDINLMRRHLNKMKEINSDLNKSGKSTQQAGKDMKKYSDDITKIQSEQADVEKLLMTETLKLPNLTHPDTPVGDESKAKVLGEYNLQNIPKFKVWDHLDIGKKYDLFDFDNGAKLATSKFVILKNQAAILEMALINYGIEFLTRKGYKFLITPDICKNSIIEGCGFQPRDSTACKIFPYLELKCIILMIMNIV
jgi:seryl-tRNA synthetase